MSPVLRGPSMPPHHPPTPPHTTRRAASPATAATATSRPLPAASGCARSLRGSGETAVPAPTRRGSARGAACSRAGVATTALPGLRTSSSCCGQRSVLARRAARVLLGLPASCVQQRRACRPVFRPCSWAAEPFLSSSTPRPHLYTGNPSPHPPFIHFLPYPWASVCVSLPCGRAHAQI